MKLAAMLVFMGLAMPGLAGAADSTWRPGSGDITVSSGDTVTVDEGGQVGNIKVDAGGQLIIPLENRISIGSSGGQSSLVNNGTIIVTGSMEFVRGGDTQLSGKGTIEISSTIDDYGNYVSMNGKQFMQFIDGGGKFIVGTNGNSPDDREHSSTLRISDDADFAPMQLSTTQFSNDIDGTIDMRKWGAIFTGQYPVTINGNELALGPVTYDMVHGKALTGDIADTEIARLRGRHLILAPNNAENTLTLTSGALHAGAGASESDPQYNQATDLKIGVDGNATLHLKGGALMLGGSGNQGGDVKIYGNIIIGQDKDQVDSALIGRVGKWEMDGYLTLNKSGYLEIGKPYLLATTGEIAQSELTVNGFKMADGAAYSVFDNALHVKNEMRGAPSSVINVINSGVLTMRNIIMNGGQINFDPEFIADGDTSNASMGGLQFESENVDARINIGRNSMVTLGSDDPEWLRGKIGQYQEKNSLLWGRDITAALAVRSPQTLAPVGGLNVDGAWTNADGAPAAANTARFADKSLFVVDAAGVGSNAALSGNGTAALKVEPGAKLLVTDGAVGDTITITDDFASADVSPAGWTANVSTPLESAEGELIDAASGRYVVRIGAGQDPARAFPMLVSELDAVLARATKQGLNTNSSEPGTRFISRAVDNRYIGSNDSTLAAATIESAARMAVVGAVPQMTLSANNAAGAAITQRTSFAQPGGIIRSVDESGNYIMESKERFARQFALWIMPLYQSANGFGMEAGNFDYDFSGALGGVALGADYTFENMLRLGVAFNIGGGYAQGGGDLNRTKNNMNFWGIGAYAGWSRNNFGLSADVNYTSTYNRLKQELPGAMRMDDLKSDVTAWAVSTGLRAEYKIATDYLDIVPHAGFRYINLNTDSYDIKSGGTVVSGDSFTQNIWTFPVGVSFTKNIALENGWNFRPLLDLNVTPAAGDLKARTNIHFTGIDQEAEIDTKMMDYVTYGGTAGIEFGNDNISLGVNYNGQFGAESSAHGIFGTFRYEF